jgi:hypothetical protein
MFAAALALPLTAGASVPNPGGSWMTVVVSGQANIFGAGHALPPEPGGGGGGVLPPAMLFAAAPAQQLVLANVTGTTSCCGSLADLANGPDGGTNASGTTDILSWNGIAGIIDGSHTMFLVAVFLDDSEPADPAPSRLDFSAGALGENFFTLAPAIGQVFYVGDGLTGTGSGATQTFAVPPTATRLFFGIADAYQFGDPTSLPGFYGDNLGSFTADFMIQPFDPTPVHAVSWGKLKSVYR